MQLETLPALELGKLIAKRALSAVETTKYFLNRLNDADREINAVIYKMEKAALAQAEEVDKRLQQGDQTLSPLAGVPLGIKDIFITKGIQTTCGSKLLEGFIPQYDSTVVAKTKAAGIIGIAKMNMDEFAMGSSNENSMFGPVKNPYDKSRVPGGSSGGSAAALAANEVPLALGTDTGGSVRQPAAFCGVVGLKPTYGRVSRYGIIAFASSFDQAGPMARTTLDSAALLNAIAGYDPHDSTSAPEPVPDYTAGLRENLKGLKLGLPREYFQIAGLEPAVKENLNKAIKKFESLGAEIIDITLKHTEYAVATYYLIATAEASSNLARYDGVRYGLRIPSASVGEMHKKVRAHFGNEVKRRIMLGTFALSSGYYDAYYLKAQKVRTLIAQDFKDAFKTVDAIIGPTSPTTAFKLGEKLEDPLTMYLSDIYTISVNLAGICAISIPCGRSPSALPVGLQIIGPAFGEKEIIGVANAFEKN